MATRDEKLQAALDKLRKRFEKRVKALAEGLAQGRITTPQWQAGFQTELRQYHLAAAAIGAGALALTDAALLQLAQQRAAGEIAYLNAWAGEIEAGTFPVDNAPKLRQRSVLYAGAALATFSAARATSLGLPRMPAYPTEGSECRTNCGCRWIYEQLEGDGNWDCTWSPSKVEHCPTCTTRANTWNPLRVRGGVIVG